MIEEPKKGIVFCGLWLTKKEFQMMVTALREQPAVALIGTILKKAYKRGDFKRR